MSSESPETPRKLLVIDASYTLEMIRERGLEQSVTCRDLDGFFEHVWSVHPFATLLTSPEWAEKYGKPVTHEIAARHTFIEGKVGRFRWLAKLFPVNFLIGQVGLFRRLRKLIEREQISAIRVGDPLYLGLFGWALARTTRIPFLIRVNANNRDVRANTGKPLYPALLRSIRREEKIERFVFPRADMVAAPNQDNVDYAVESGAHADRVTIFRYGNLLADEHLQEPSTRKLDTALFDRFGIEPGKYLLCIGRLIAVKFPDDTVRVLGALVKDGLDLKLVMAGDGPMREELQALADGLGVGDRLIFAGNLDQKTLAQLNPNAAAVVSPLTGRALSEAALGGAPIAAYDLDWQGDLVRTGETGELVPFREVEALAAATGKLVRDRNYAARMGRAVRQRALAILNPAELNEHERQEYTKLLARFAQSGAARP